MIQEEQAGLALQSEHPAKIPFWIFPKKTQYIMDFMLFAYCYEIILHETKIKSAVNLIWKNSSMSKAKEKVLV